MPDNLARFGRLARRATERREVEEAKQRERERRLFAVEERQARNSPEYRAGPPNGCTACYGWVFDMKRNYPSPWGWLHQAPVDPEERMTDLYGDGDPFLVEFCTHTCHGPGGLPLPLIALA